MNDPHYGTPDWESGSTRSPRRLSSASAAVTRNRHGNRSRPTSVRAWKGPSSAGG